MEPKKQVQKNERKNRFSEELFPPSETLLLYGDRRLLAEGCKQILTYTPENIRLELTQKILSILGKNLSCTAFSQKFTTVEGKITSLVLEAKEKR